jgi:Arc/MetJ-type ribon-helix-helix transcriptional regulator
MMITLTDEQTTWLAAQVADGRFKTVDEAARAKIDDQMAAESEDLDWVRPLLDEARAGLERGETVCSEEIEELLAGYNLSGRAI